MKLSNYSTIKIIIAVIACLMVVAITIIIAAIARGKHSTVSEPLSYSTQEMDEYTSSNEITPILPDSEEEISIEDIPEVDLEKANLDNKKENKKESNNAVSGSVSSNGKPYYIKVNYGANVVTVYSLDENNNYTVPVKAMVCSTGTATPRYRKICIWL